MRFPVVLFDFDGTIADTGPIIADSYRDTVASVLGRELDPAELPGIFRAGALEAQMAMLDPARIPELDADATARSTRRTTGRLTAFPGMVALLETLRREERRLGIVSSKRTAMVELSLELLPLARTSSTSSSERRTPPGTSRIRCRSCTRWSGWTRAAGTRSTSVMRRWTSSARAPPACARSR